ncbi:hypothetical protein ILUMI_13590 [Ignelater luminosus]|uniref:Uncharacterized protein n=1 Tax=Ignelater luminosus TaxID=2038154 RepID=A0A8K0G8I6_IGNLU|nr:hypothetical protein ILUMI_13590 [Ignelater luminosus]
MIRTIFIFSFILFNTIFQVKTSLTNNKCSALNDFRSYTHCIRKREATNWCSAQGCTTCEGTSCQVSCKGFSCGNCPNGNCCNGRNCNACYNENCCTTPSCNYCLNTCRQACTASSTCLNTCSLQCPNTPHEVFIVPSKLQSNGKQDVVIYINGIAHNGQVTSGVIPNGNRTAIVNVNGIDHMATVLSLIPTYPNSCQTGSSCGSTCSNNAPNRSQRIIYQNYHQQLQQGCCHVVHPSQCFNNHIYPYRHCFRRSHQECSNLCTSQFVHLIPNLTPQPHQQNQCHYIRSYPYVYCGQHSVQNCDPCYVCNGQYNPNSCVTQNGCSDVCRQTFLPPRYQQSQPSVPYYQHHGSYQLVHPGAQEYQQIMNYLQSQRAYAQNGIPLQYG